jgi:energy-converting hydrogenase A subunit M
MKTDTVHPLLQDLNVPQHELMDVLATCSRIHALVMDAVDLRKEYVLVAFFMMGILLDLIGGCSFLVLIDFYDHGDLTDDVQLRLKVSGSLLLAIGLILMVACVYVQTRKINAAMKTAQEQVDSFLCERKDLKDSGLRFVVTHERVQALQRRDDIEVVIEPAIKVFVDANVPSNDCCGYAIDMPELSVLEKV